MKKVLIIWVMCTLTCYSQAFRTYYSKNANGNYCNKEEMVFTFKSEELHKYDVIYNQTSVIPSKIESTGFENNGLFYEKRTPAFYLNKYGVNRYRQIKQMFYKLIYKSKGGSLLYIIELDPELGVEKAKAYYTKEGYELFCK